MTHPLVEKVTRLYHLDRERNLPAIARNDIPHSYEHMTPQWLTAVLCAAHPRAAVLQAEFAIGVFANYDPETHNSIVLPKDRALDYVRRLASAVDDLAALDRF